MSLTKMWATRDNEVNRSKGQTFSVMGEQDPYLTNYCLEYRLVTCRWIHNDNRISKKNKNHQNWIDFEGVMALARKHVLGKNMFFVKMAMKS